MRRHLFPRPFRMLLATLLTALACGFLPCAGGLASGAPPAVPQIAGDVYEPDNNFISSSTIASGSTQYDHNFHLPGDEDWAQFGAAAGAHYVIETLNAEEFCDTVLRLVDTDGITEITFVDNWGSGRGERIEWTATASGTYYIRVRHFNDTFGEDTHYDLSLSSNADAYEPDDDYTKSSPIATGDIQRDHDFHATDDEDWVQFSALSGMVYTFETTNLGPNCDTHVYLVDTDGTSVLTDNDDYGGGKGSRIEWLALTDDTTYVRVVNRSGASGDGTTYDISMDSTYDAYEPDDDYTKASTLAPYCTQSRHSFHVADDEDWMAFSAVRSLTYTIETLNLGPNCDTILALVDTDGFTIIAFIDNPDPAEGERIEWVPSADGTYYVHVRNFNNLHGAGTGYDVLVRAPVSAYCPLVRLD